MKIAGAALNQTPIAWDNNLDNILRAIKMAKEDGVDILCLPELCITGYGCEDLFLSEWIAEKAFKQLHSILPSTKGIAVAVGLPVRHKGNVYDAACLMEDGNILGFVPKQNLADRGVYYEPRWFTPWKKGTISNLSHNNTEYQIGDLIFELKNGTRVGFEICEDAWSPGRPGISLKERMVDVILNLSASHFAFGKAGSRAEEIIKSSKELDCWYVCTNLLGNEAGKIIYDGQVIIANKGVLKAAAPILCFEQVSFAMAQEDSTAIYDKLCKNEEFHRAVSLGLFDYLRKSKLKSYVLSLSGGADSSACAVLIMQMIRNGIKVLGKKEFCSRLGINAPEDDRELEKQLCSKMLYTAYQATLNSSQKTFESAENLAKYIGAKFYHWNVDEEIDSYKNKIESAIERNLDWDKDGIALENIQARSRSPVIWLLANVTNSLLITASNRSELDVGYATMDGDTSGGIAPIAGVDKNFIKSWLLWAEKELGYEALSKVNRLKASAELRPAKDNQTDEGELMPFEILQQIERKAILEQQSPVEIFKRLSATAKLEKEELKNYILKFFRLWSANQWKRERMAPAFHLDDFSIDPRSWYRFPIFSGRFSEELEELEKYEDSN